MLFVLTAADLRPSGPGVLNAWKVEVLTDVSSRTMRAPGRGCPGLAQSKNCCGSRREDVLGRVKEGDDRPGAGRQIGACPAPYLANNRPEQIAEEFRRLHRLSRGDAAVRPLSARRQHGRIYDRHLREMSPGVFHKLAGAAERARDCRFSRRRSTPWPTAWCSTGSGSRIPITPGAPPSRLEQVERAIVESLKGPVDSRPAFRRVWRPGDAGTRGQPEPAPHPVRFDNSTSDRYTMIEFFAADRMGLLYTITQRAVRTRAFGVGRQDRHVSRPGGRRVLRDGSIRPANRRSCSNGNDPHETFGRGRRARSFRDQARPHGLAIVDRGSGDRLRGGAPGPSRPPNGVQVRLAASAGSLGRRTSTAAP